MLSAPPWFHPCSEGRSDAALTVHVPPCRILDEALSLLGTHGEDAKVLAGGQSLIPLMKLRFANPEHLIDVNHVDGLDGIEERDGQPADRRADAPPRR